MNGWLGKRQLFMILVVAVLSSLGVSTLVMAFSQTAPLTDIDEGEDHGQQTEQDNDKLGPDMRETGNYTDLRTDVAGDKIELEEMEFGGKTWVEYVDYVEYDMSPVQADGGDCYKLFVPEDAGSAVIMAVRDCAVSEEMAGQDITWQDMIPLFKKAATGNYGVVFSDEFAALCTRQDIAEVFGDIDPDEMFENAAYYADPACMGIVGDPEWNGISNGNFYDASALTVSLSGTRFSVAKTGSGSFATSLAISVKDGFDTAVLSDAIADCVSAVCAVNGINNEYVQSGDATAALVYEAREDMAGIAWKLCEYTIRIPVKVKKYDANGNVTEEVILNCDCARGVFRVFANGYAEQPNSGKTVLYADVLDGFRTADQLIARAKSQQAAGE